MLHSLSLGVGMWAICFLFCGEFLFGDDLFKANFHSVGSNRNFMKSLRFISQRWNRKGTEVKARRRIRVGEGGSLTGARDSRCRVPRNTAGLWVVDGLCIFRKPKGGKHTGCDRQLGATVDS